MKKFLVVVFIALAAVFAGCDNPVDTGKGGSSRSFSFDALTQDGGDEKTTSRLTLRFNRNIADFNEGDISLSGEPAEEVSKGVISHTGTGVYSLPLNGISMSGSLTVTVNKDGYKFEPASRDVDVFFYSEPVINFKSLAANGSTSQTTNLLTFAFDGDIDGLDAGDIALSGAPAAQVIKGSLTRTDTGVYTLPVNGITVGGLLGVTVVKQGLNIQPPFRAVTVWIPQEQGQAGDSAFIDFSGYTGPSTPLDSHQPQEGTVGPFTLPNGITGDGLRISNSGDNSAAVTITQYGGQMAARSDNFLYFYIDKASIKNAPTVTVNITFQDLTSGNLSLQYVTADNAYARVTISRNNTNTFMTKSVQLDYCDFNADQQQNQGAQFRIEGSRIIQKIELVEGGAPDPLLDPPPPFAPQTNTNTMIGKGVAGYQAWFSAPGWGHWRSGGGGLPRPEYVNVELWPAGWEDYTANGATLHDTGFTMPNGSTARLFNSTDAPVIRTHFQWMRDAGIDGAAVQRFYNSGSADHLPVIRDAAEDTNRIFYVMYDMTGAGGYNQNTNLNTAIRWTQLDWINNIERKGIVSSPNYAHAEDKPVVCIWGVHAIESTDNYRYIKVEAAIQLIQWFRDRGYYVIGGIPDDVFWTQTGRGRDLYRLLDMISPWYIGRDVTGQILGGGQWLANGLEFCRSNRRSWAGNRSIAFLPTIWPGFAWTNMSGNSGTPNQVPRNSGQWAWTQVKEYLTNDTNKAIQSFYLAMFDEYDEATAWMKGGVDFFDIPLDQYFQTHSADGKWLSSDYYLRVAKAAVSALKTRNTRPLNDYGNADSVIVEHSLGPVFWRNSFERRNWRLKYGASEGQSGVITAPVNHLQIDVGIPNGGVIGSPQNVTVTGAFTVNRPAVIHEATSDSYTPPSTTLGMIYTDNAKSGGSAFRLAGTRTAGSGASYLYRIADTRIKVNSTMSLSFWQRAENSLGANVIVDLLMDNGVYLSGVTGYNLRDDGAAQSGWQKKTVDLPASLNGRYITAVIAAYKDSGTATGSFAALIDDIIISNN